MRYVSSSAQRKLNSQLEESRFETQKFQEQLSTGQRIQKASEDPGAFAAASRIRVNLAELDADGAKLDNGEAWLRHQDETLGDMTTTARQMKNLALRANNAAVNEQVFESIANEVDSLINRGLELANTRVGKSYLFSGSQKTTKPFEVQRTGGSVTSVAYQGDSAPPPLGLPNGQSMPLNLNGRDVVSGSGEDFFEVAIEFRDALRSGNLDGDDVLQKLEDIEDNFINRRGEAAAAGRHLGELSQRLVSRRFELESQTQELVGVDPAEAASKFFQSQNQTQVTMALIGRQNELNLIDFLR